MAEGGYERIPEEEGKSNPGYDDNNDDDYDYRRWQERGENPKKPRGEGMEMKDER